MNSAWDETEVGMQVMGKSSGEEERGSSWRSHAEAARELSRDQIPSLSVASSGVVLVRPFINAFTPHHHV